MNSNNWIVKYEPLCIITTFSKRKYYIKQKNREKLEKEMQKNKFVRFWDSTVNVSWIDTIELATSEDNFIEFELSRLNSKTRNEVKNEIQIYKNTHNRSITNWVLQNMIKKYENNC